MNILAVDDERLALDALVAEVKVVFKNEDIRAERSSPAAISYANELKENGKELDYAFLDIHLGSKSGLELAARIIDGIPGICVFHLSDKDIVRHSLVQKIINAYEKFENRKREVADKNDKTSPATETEDNNGGNEN